MPNHTHLASALLCPFCRHVVTDDVAFQWGYCPAQRLRKDYLYHLGDPIVWRRCADGLVHSWAYFMAGEHADGANIGDPAITDLVTRDVGKFSWRDPMERLRCPFCAQPLEGVAIEIRAGVIQRAWIYQPGELDNAVDIFLMEADGTLRPVPEWNDHPMATVEAC